MPFVSRHILARDLNMVNSLLTSSTDKSMVVDFYSLAVRVTLAASLSLVAVSAV